MHWGMSWNGIWMESRCFSIGFADKILSFNKLQCLLSGAVPNEEWTPSECCSQTSEYVDDLTVSHSLLHSSNCKTWKVLDYDYLCRIFYGLRKPVMCLLFLLPYLVSMQAVFVSKASQGWQKNQKRATYWKEDGCQDTRYAHPPIVCQQKWVVADQAESLPPRNLLVVVVVVVQLTVTWDLPQSWHILTPPPKLQPWIHLKFNHTSI